MAAFPQSPLDLRAELSLAGTWTDVSHYVMQRAGTQSPVPITRGRPDETARANPGAANVELNNRDGRFSPKNPTGAYYGQLGRNTPLRLSVPAQANYLRLENDNAGQAFVNDTAALHITGSIEMRIAVQLTDWQGATLAAYWTAWEWYLTPAGFLAFAWDDSGSVLHTAVSTLPVPFTRSQFALRVTMDATTGNVTFYTASSIDGTYTQLGAVVNPVGAATSILSSASALRVGYNASLASQPTQLRGRVAEYRLYNGIGGTVVADTVMSGVTAGATTWTDSKGLTWNISGGAEVSSRDYRWHGETSSLPPRWDPTGTDIAVQVASGGLLRRLGQGSAPIQSPVRRAVSQQSSLAQYWPMEDGAGATAFGSATGGPPMAIGGSPTLASDNAFPGSAALPKLNGASFLGRVPAYTGTSAWVVRALVHPGTSGTGSAVLKVITTGTCTDVNVLYEGGSSLEITGNAGSTSVFNSGVRGFSTLPGGTLQQPLWMSLELTFGAGTTSWVLALLPLGSSALVQATGSFTGTPGNVTAVYVNPQGGLSDWSAGHVSVQAGTQPAVSTLSSPFNGWPGEPAAVRFARILGENGLTARVLGPASATAPMGVQPVATLASVLQECEAADRGMIHEPRQVFGLAYRTLASMLNQSPSVTLDYSQAQAGGTGAALEPVYDDQFIKNDETVTRAAPGGGGMTYQYQLNDGSAMSIGSPPAGIGDYANSDTVNCQLDTQVPHLAGWIVHVGTADVARWPAIPVNLARSEIQSGSLYYPLLGLDAGDYLQVVNMLGQVVADPVPVIVSGVKESLGGFHHEVTYNCAPEAPYEVIVLDDLVRGRCDTDGSALCAAATSAATTLYVASAGIPWTQAAGDLPFDIGVAGERVTVTAVAAGGSGSVTSPGAFSYIVTVPIPAGTWTIGWTVTLSGTVGAPEANNFGLTLNSGSTIAAPSVNAGAAGTYPQASVTFTVAAADTLVVKSWSNTATSGAVYAATITSPQAFTVTRSVNGVAKAQAIGAGVRLWLPPILSLT